MNICIRPWANHVASFVVIVEHFGQKRREFDLQIYQKRNTSGGGVLPMDSTFLFIILYNFDLEYRNHGYFYIIQLTRRFFVTPLIHKTTQFRTFLTTYFTTGKCEFCLQLNCTVHIEHEHNLMIR